MPGRLNRHDVCLFCMLKETSYHVCDRRRAKQPDVDALRKAMRDSKGLGSFKNLFFYAPDGKADGIKIVPLR